MLYNLIWRGVKMENEQYIINENNYKNKLIEIFKLLLNNGYSISDLNQIYIFIYNKKQ